MKISRLLPLLIDDKNLNVLEFDVKLNRVEWTQLFVLFGALYRMLPFWIGDAQLSARYQLGEQAQPYVEKSGLSSSQLEDFERLSERWSERAFNLPWSYYRDAGFDKEIAEPLLAATEKNGWSRDQMREARKKLEEKVNDRQ